VYSNVAESTSWQGDTVKIRRASNELTDYSSPIHTLTLRFLIAADNDMVMSSLYI
jgi:hypothetical protein